MFLFVRKVGSAFCGQFGEKFVIACGLQFNKAFCGQEFQIGFTQTVNALKNTSVALSIIFVDDLQIALEFFHGPHPFFLRFGMDLTHFNTA